MCMYCCHMRKHHILKQSLLFPHSNWERLTFKKSNSDSCVPLLVITTQWPVQISRCIFTAGERQQGETFSGHVVFSLLWYWPSDCGHLTKIIAAFPLRALCISYPQEAAGDLDAVDPWCQDLSSVNLFMNFYGEGEGRSSRNTTSKL